MFPTTKHLNMGGSIHGGAVMSFIDMALFAGGRIAGMGEGHYVTLDCATHFIARGRIGVPLDAVVRLVGQTKGGHVFLSGHCEQDGQPTPQLHRHAEAHPRQRPSRRMTGPVGKAYAALVAAGELKPDPDQAQRGRGARPLCRLPRASRTACCSRLFGKAERGRAASICGAGSGAASRC